eukprot:2197433-Rhodomonas_salina.1
MAKHWRSFTMAPGTPDTLSAITDCVFAPYTQYPITPTSMYSAVWPACPDTHPRHFVPCESLIAEGCMHRGLLARSVLRGV